MNISSTDVSQAPMVDMSLPYVQPSSDSPVHTFVTPVLHSIHLHDTIGLELLIKLMHDQSFQKIGMISQVVLYAVYTILEMKSPRTGLATII